MKNPKFDLPVKVFLEMVDAARSGIDMQPRSANDKEYFAQDWFAARLTSLRVPFKQQGRNSYPDYLVGHPTNVQGFEIKSLQFQTKTKKPARSDIDFNSTIPSGYKDRREQFVVFFLYTGGGRNPRPVHSISLAHGDFINSDHEVADDHLNVAVRQFGSYADGFIRNRKMYVFPHPVTLDPNGIGRFRLILPTSWGVTHPRLAKKDTIERHFSQQRVDGYSITLRGKQQADVTTTPNPSAGQVIRFDVFEAI